MNSKQLEALIADADIALKRLRVLYDQWFSGIERIEPQQQRDAFERLLKTLVRDQTANTAVRFRVQQLQQRYMTYNTYWKRVARQIEEGTYQRDVLRARRKREQREQHEARRQEVHELELDIDVELDMDAMMSDALSSVSSYAEVPGTDAGPHTRATHRPESAPVPRRDPDPPGQALVRRDGPREDGPTEPSSPAPSPSMAPTAGSGRSSRRFPAPPASGPVVAFGQAPTGPPAAGAAAADRQPLRSQGRPAGVFTAPPRADGSDASQSAPTRSGQALPGGPPPPAKRPVIVAPDLSRPPAPAGGSPVPVGGPPGLVSGRPTAPAPAGVAQGAAPKPRPASPGPAPARPGPPRPAAPRRTPAKAARPNGASGGGGQGNPMSDQQIRAIYDRYIQARARNAERTDNVRVETIAKTVRQMMPKLQQKHGGKQIEFEPVVRNGKVALKPVPK